MKIDFDLVKSEQNIKLRSLSFDRAGDFDWETAICFTPIDGGVRIISFRKANRREVRCYEEETANR